MNIYSFYYNLTQKFSLILEVILFTFDNTKHKQLKSHQRDIKSTLQTNLCVGRINMILK